jgi:hypothetical protein
MNNTIDNQPNRMVRVIAIFAASHENRWVVNGISFFYCNQLFFYGSRNVKSFEK